MIDLDYLKSILYYEPETGIWTWLVKRKGSKRNIGEQAGWLGLNGYWYLSVDYKQYQSSRLAWFYMTGEWLSRKEEIDHEDTNPANDAWYNLRRATRAQQNANRKSYNKLGIKGVNYREKDGMFYAQITHNKKQYNLGCFHTLEEAIDAHEKASKEFYGEFSRCY